ncbi:hypothetical protein HDF16_006291 [Granulicella aggregans]|uniref:Uncharacterized protein n=1 Tax=Granulicella aggregans TaxID=474949 RepID=A0A7W7ZKF4_9BACT|nr:hypothetical protein [Granulicella aggregans]MBB5061555.1 hypothetical protein [Granulicella aggregans]
MVVLNKPERRGAVLFALLVSVSVSCLGQGNSLPRQVVIAADCVKGETAEECAARRATDSGIGVGNAFLALPNPNYSRARTACESALVTARTVEQRQAATACFSTATRGIHAEQHREIGISLRDIDTALWKKDFAHAASLSDALRKQYASWPSEMDGPNEYITDQLQMRPGDFSEHPVLYPKLKAFGTWVLNTINYLVSVLKYVVYVLGIGVGLWLVVLAIATKRRNARESCQERDGKNGRTGWRVWNITDKDGTGAAGVIMEALKLGNNTLLRDHYLHQYVAPSLLLSPLPATEQEPGQGITIWWNFLAGRKWSCPIETVPVAEMGRHTFSFEEALDDIDLKVAGTDIRGVFSAYRSLRRWYYQGYPELQATVGSSGEDKDKVATIRLTCNIERGWGGTAATTPSAAAGSARTSVAATAASVAAPLTVGGVAVQTNTISVFASSEPQRFADHLGLAAHRAAFKLFYRLAEPGIHPDHVGAVASFFQGMSLLLLLL